jgi:hypothetical protein
MNQRFWESPARVFWWLFGAAVLPTGLGVVLLLSRSTGRLAIVSLAVGVFAIGQALIYCPKAYRAARRKRT